MKLMKKIIAVAAALSMTMASAGAVLAEEGTIEGGAEYVNTTVYKLTLPTTAGIDFTLDPQGLLSITTGTAIDDIEDKGTITGSGVMVAYSESSVDVTCSAAFYIEAATSTAVTTAAAAPSVTTQAVGLQINYEVKQNASYESDVSGVAISDVNAGAPLDVTATAVSDASVINEKLDKVAYIATGNAVDGFKYVKQDTDEVSLLYMYIGGTVSTDADWSSYANGTDTIKLKTVFTFKNAENAEVATAKEVYAAMDRARSLLLIGSDMTQPTPASFGNISASDVSNIKIAGHALTKFTVTSNGYITIDGGDAYAAGGADFKSPLNITFTVKGVDYTTTVTWSN